LVILQNKKQENKIQRSYSPVDEHPSVLGCCALSTVHNGATSHKH
jgi:hypothetical protein